MHQLDTGCGPRFKSARAYHFYVPLSTNPNTLSSNKHSGAKENAEETMRRPDSIYARAVARRSDRFSRN
jgi:hypothetical protein